MNKYGRYTNYRYVNELTRDELIQLKVDYLRDQADDNGEPLYWNNLMDADVLVSDEDIFDIWAGTMFIDDDFCKEAC